MSCRSCSSLLRAATEQCTWALGVFWGSIEVMTDLDFAGEDVDYQGIKSGSFLLMEYLVSIADGLHDETGK